MNVGMRCRRLTRIGSLSDLLLAVTEKEELESRADVRLSGILRSIRLIALLRIDAGVDVAMTIDAKVDIGSGVGVGVDADVIIVVLRLRNRLIRTGALSGSLRHASNTTTV